MNKVIMIGRLAADPTLKYTPSNTAVASFRLAVNKDTKDGGADFIPCKVFGVQAENLEKYKGKGDEIAVEGRIETGSYKKSDGTTVYTTEVVCSRVEYTHGSKGGEATAPKKSESRYTEPSINSMADGELPDSFEQLDEDLPF